MSFLYTIEINMDDDKVHAHVKLYIHMKARRFYQPSQDKCI